MTLLVRHWLVCLAGEGNLVLNQWFSKHFLDLDCGFGAMFNVPRSHGDQVCVLMKFFGMV